MALLIFYVLLALLVSFLCSVLEAVLLSVSPSYVARMVDDGRYEAILKHVHASAANVDGRGLTPDELLGWGSLGQSNHSAESQGAADGGFFAPNWSRFGMGSKAAMKLLADDVRGGSDDENAHGRGRCVDSKFPGAAQTVQFFSYAVPKIAVISFATRRTNRSALQPKSGGSVESRARRDDQGEILGVNARKKLGAAIGLIGLERSRGSSSNFI